MVDYFVMRPWRGGGFQLVITRALDVINITPDTAGLRIRIRTPDLDYFTYIYGSFFYPGFWTTVDGVWYYNDGVNAQCTYTESTNMWDIQIAAGNTSPWGEDYYGYSSDTGYWVDILTYSDSMYGLGVQVAPEPATGEDPIPDIYKTAEKQQESGLIFEGLYIVELPYWQIGSLTDIGYPLYTSLPCPITTVPVFRKTGFYIYNWANPSWKHNEWVCHQSTRIQSRTVKSSIPYKINYQINRHWVNYYYREETYLTDPTRCTGDIDCSFLGHFVAVDTPMVQYQSDDLSVNSTINFTGVYSKLTDVAYSLTTSGEFVAAEEEQNHSITITNLLPDPDPDWPCYNALQALAICHYTNLISPLNVFYVIPLYDY